jgi:uncharacterized protein (TIGR03086 family)
MTDAFDRYQRAADGFGRVLGAVRAEQWCWPTPCAEWNVRQLVNHMTRGNLNFALLAEGGGRADFLRLREADSLGGEPKISYGKSVRECVAAFAGPGVLDLILDYPLGKMTARQALAVRTTDSVIHTWDLARAVGGDETLDADLVAWIGGNLDEIYGGLAETPVDPGTTHRFFAPPVEAPGAVEPRHIGQVPPAGTRGTESDQDRLLRRMGRTPEAAPDVGG